MPDMVRMGVRASIAEDQRALGWSGSEVVAVDEAGNEVARELVPDEPGLVLQVVHFVDLDDGGRVTTEALGNMSLSVPWDCTLDELREDLRDFIFEDEVRELDDVLADDQALLALPFIVELDDDVAAELDG